jgi:leucyl-tRNA synthetase
VGADSLRLFHLFVGPPGDDFDWASQTDQMIEGCHRFLGRLWRLATGSVANASVVDRPASAEDAALVKETHRLIDRVNSDFERWSYNTAVAGCMEFLNSVYKYVQSPAGGCRSSVDFAVDSLLLLLAPMAPHITAELWEGRHPSSAPVHAQAWPVADPAMLTVDTVTMVVQVNGKVRDRIEVVPDITSDDAAAVALASPRVAAGLDAAEPKKVIARPPRLVNIVV